MRSSCSRPLLALVLLATFTGGCMGPIVRPAPFPQRPESIKRGSLLGPFEGRVIDADTRKPLEKAVVWCSWAFDRGVGSTAPEATRVQMVATDPDGRYLIPQLKALPLGLSTRLTKFSMLVYRPGYVAYRHDRRFSGERRRLDFAQLGNVVRLTRWSPELSHARHLLFLGGPPALRARAHEDLLAAAIELDREDSPSARRKNFGKPAVAGPTRRKNFARLLLDSDEVRKVTSYTGTLRGARLASPGDATDSWHLRAVDKAERYDVAVRLWRLAGDAAKIKYEALLAALPGSQQKDTVADRSFVVTQGEIVGLGFLSTTRSAIVLLTCGRGQCTTDAQLTALAKLAAKNLQKLPTASPLGLE